MLDKVKRTRRICIYCNLFWILFSLTTIIEASHLRVGSFNKPGPGLFPLSTGIIMLILALAALFQGLRKKTGGGKTREEEAASGEFRWWNIIIILASIVAYALTIDKVGFLINTFVFITLLLKVVEPQTWKTSVIGGVITAIAANLVFNVIFGAQIPSGILGF